MEDPMSTFANLEERRKRRDCERLLKRAVQILEAQVAFEELTRELSEDERRNLPIVVAFDEMYRAAVILRDQKGGKVVSFEDAQALVQTLAKIEMAARNNPKIKTGWAALRQEMGV